MNGDRRMWAIILTILLTCVPTVLICYGRGIEIHRRIAPTAAHCPDHLAFQMWLASPKKDQVVAGVLRDSVALCRALG
jgi:hypothetical protein